MDLDDARRVGAGLLVQPVDVLGDERVEPAAALEVDQRPVARVGLASPTWARSGGSARTAAAARGRDVGLRAWPSSRPRGSWSTRPGAPGSRGCPSRSRCRRPSARRPGEPAPPGHGPGPVPASGQSRPSACHGGTAAPYAAPVPAAPPPSSCSARPTPRSASAGPPARCSPGAARRGDRVAFALGSSADLICAVLGAARVGPHPRAAQRHADRRRARPPGRGRRPVLRVFDRARPGRPRRTGRPAELAPYPLTRPMHYTSGTTGRPKGVTTGIWDEATARAVFEDEAAVWHFDRRRPAPGLLADVPHGLDPLLGGHAALGGVAGHPEPLRRRHRPRCRCGATARPPPSSSRPTCSASCSARRSAATSVRLAAPPGPRRRPCPESVKRATMARVRPGGVWEFYGSTEAQFTVCSPEEWLERPGTVGRARPGRRLSIQPARGRRDDSLGARGRHLVRHARLRPLHLLGRPRGHTAGPGAAPPAPSATWAASMPTATST